MDKKYLMNLVKNNFLFWLSRKINYPLIPPDMVQVNFTFDCNLRCKMCSMYDQKMFLANEGKQIEIDSDVFRKIIRETKELGTKTILFIGGEPFLRKDLFELVEYARGYGLTSVAVTNGVLLNESTIENCFKSGLDWLSISIDAASEERFSKIRGENYLGRIIENLNILNGLKDNKKSIFPKIVAVCTIMNDNLEELLEIIELCKKLKLERILFQPVVANNIDQTQRDVNSPGFIAKDRWKTMDDVIGKLIAYKKTSPSNFDFIGNNIRDLKLIKKYFRNTVRYWELPCYAGYNRLQIIQEGKIYFCVNQEKYVASFGDLKHESLKELWFSKKAGSYRRLIRECKSPCLQWCSYRNEFMELSAILQKRLIFGKNWEIT
ncbi:MAG TPA: hypothetical protein DCE80_06690 [Ignavibacteriales bacterium]|nr:hypothetical protein [Ignavibacteriales bacterium]